MHVLGQFYRGFSIFNLVAFSEDKAAVYARWIHDAMGDDHDLIRLILTRSEVYPFIPDLHCDAVANAHLYPPPINVYFRVSY